MNSRQAMVARVTALAVACIGLLDGRVVAQAHPDFSGTWVVEKVDHAGGGASEGPDGMGGPRGGGRRGPGGAGGPGGGFGGPGGGGFGGGRRGGGGRGPGSGGDGERPEGERPGGRPGPGPMYHVGEVVTIKQSTDFLIVTREGEGVTSMVSYALDGSEVKHDGLAGGASSSKSRWEGVALVTELSTVRESPRGKMTMKSREVRTLGSDRDVMTVTVTLETPRGKELSTVTFGRR